MGFEDGGALFAGLIGLVSKYIRHRSVKRSSRFMFGIFIMYGIQWYWHDFCTEYNSKEGSNITEVYSNTRTSVQFKM